jgi:cytochrome c oxidase subunit 4
MSRLKLYSVIYVVLFVSATFQVLVEQAGLEYVTAFSAIMVLSFVKAVLVAGYYQHLRWEPRSITYLIGVGLVAALALTVAATYSIS